MPELPDVERFRQRLADHGLDKAIREVEVLDDGVIRGTSAHAFAAQLKGCAFTEADRLGKWLIARTEGPAVIFHFGMTGSLEWTDTKSEPERFDRVRFTFSRGRLVYRDQRKLRGMWLTEGSDRAIRAVTGPLGPDALGLSATRLRKRLDGHQAVLKTLLMDQRVVAGLGNMLSDEVLWRARLHPRRTFAELDNEERGRLSRSLQQVLRASVRAGAIPRNRTWLSAQRASPRPHCPRGHGPLRTERINGRTSYVCPTCQPAPR